MTTSKHLLCSDQLYIKNGQEASISHGFLSSKRLEITFGGEKKPNMAKCTFNSQRHFLFSATSLIGKK